MGAGSHKNPGFQAIGKIEILSACRMLVSMPATLHGFPGLNSPQVGVSELSYISFPGEQLISFLPAPCQLWPLGLHMLVVILQIYSNQFRWKALGKGQGTTQLAP